LRWWAAFAVFGHHILNLTPLPAAAFLTLGDFGVTFFFVLSGFVLTWSAKASTTKGTFWWRRLARIYPSHIVALAVAIPVFYSFNPDPAQWWVKPVDVGVLLLSVFLLQGWSKDPTILFSGNPAAWTLSCEAFFYALHPYINRLLAPFDKRRSLAAAGVVVGVAFAYRAALVIWPHSWLGAIPYPVSRLTEFVLGMCLASCLLNGWRVRIAPLWCFGAVFGYLGWLAWSSHQHGLDPVSTFFITTSNEWMIVLCGLTIAAVARRDITGAFSMLRARVLVVLGEWSYAFYLVHATVIYAVLAVVGRQPGGWHGLAWAGGLLVLSLAAAALLHYIVERPAERFMRSWWDSGRQLRRQPASPGV
jgi:peptidoglycan/LPS O-acetylase OafA/YrhL